MGAVDDVVVRDRFARCVGLGVAGFDRDRIGDQGRHRGGGAVHDVAGAFVAPLARRPGQPPVSGLNRAAYSDRAGGRKRDGVADAVRGLNPVESECIYRDETVRWAGCTTPGRVGQHCIHTKGEAPFAGGGDRTTPSFGADTRRPRKRRRFIGRKYI